MGDEHSGAIWAAGVAAAALLVVLVVAVLRTSDSSHAPAFVPPAPSTDYSSTSRYATSSSSTTSYRVPSVQTSQDTGATVSTDGPAEELPTDESTAATPTTTSNPYGTTTPTNAGHV